MYDKIDDLENHIVDAKVRKRTVEQEKMKGDNIYRVLIYFDKLYKLMDKKERRQLVESLVSEIQIYEEKKPSGQWLKSIEFKLPIIKEDTYISLDNQLHIGRAYCCLN